MIFVTGGTGMVGAHLLVELVKKGERVRALRRRSSDLSQVKKIFEWSGTSDLFANIEWVDGDICDLWSLEAHLRNVTTVFHAAAIVSFDKRKQQEILENNREGTACLIDASIKNKVEKFCHVSSIASLGDAPEGMVTTEDCIWNGDKGRSIYSKSKYLSEMEVWRGQTEGLDVVIVNPSVILGSGTWTHGSPQFFTTVAKGLKFYTSGGTGFVDVLDVVKAMLQLVNPKHWNKVKNERYVISAENILYKDLFCSIADRLNVKKPKILAGDFLLGLGWRLSTFLASITQRSIVLTKESARSSKSISTYGSDKLKNALQFKFTPIEDTIQRIAKCYLEK